MKKEKIPSVGLCWRCEKRAKYHETGFGPRYECKQPNSAVCGCYAYEPVAPCIIEPSERETRDISLPAMLSGRARFVDVAMGDWIPIKMGGKRIMKMWFEQLLWDRMMGIRDRYNKLVKECKCQGKCKSNRKAKK